VLRGPLVVSAMSVMTNADSQLELPQLPNREFVLRYQQSLSRHAGDDLAPPRHGGESADEELDNPHDPMNMDKVRIEMTAFVPYDAQKRCYSLKLSHGDMEDFLSLSNPHNTPYDLSRAIVRRVTVHALDGLPSGRWTLNVLDGAPRKVQKTLVGKKWGVHVSGRFNMRGMPVPMVDLEKEIYKNEGPVEDVLRYGSFSMDRIVGGVLPVPERHNPHHLVPAFPNGMFFCYALNHGQNRVKNLTLDPTHDYLRIPNKEYEMVVAAYERKLKEVEAKMHDLTSMEILIEPLADDVVAAGSDSMLCMTIKCYLPRVDGSI
jgi:hypothetical protein